MENVYTDKFKAQPFKLGNGVAIYLPKEVYDKFPIGENLTFDVKNINGDEGDEIATGNNKCSVCEGEAKVRHHLVPEFLGGTELILLCHKCHAKAHWLYRQKAQEEIYKQNSLFFKELIDGLKKIYGRYKGRYKGEIITELTELSKSVAEVYTEDDAEVCEKDYTPQFIPGTKIPIVEPDN